MCVRTCVHLSLCTRGKKRREDNLSLNIAQTKLFSASMADSKISKPQQGRVRQGMREAVRIFRC